MGSSATSRCVGPAGSSRTALTRWCKERGVLRADGIFAPRCTCPRSSFSFLLTQLTVSLSFSSGDSSPLYHHLAPSIPRHPSRNPGFLTAHTRTCFGYSKYMADFALVLCFCEAFKKK
eukprot:RCo055763